jgi:23S rRNA (guanine745-N1)-methyltransferase
MRAAWDVLACSVRGCGAPLERGEQGFACPAGHAFDRARSGYVNLLQPQDRRSLAAGDARAAVAARVALRARGAGAAVDAGLARLTQELGLPQCARAIDLGCGTGDHLAALCEGRAWSGLGLDLSAHAAGIAARRHPALAWAVANCDRVLPVRSGSVDLVLSVDGRRNPAEMARVLQPAGFALVAVPAAGDLRELRAACLEDVRDLPGLPRVVDELTAPFDLVDSTLVDEVIELDQAGLRDLALASYRHGRRREDERLASLSSLRVTLAHEIGLFRRRAS